TACLIAMLLLLLTACGGGDADADREPTLRLSVSTINVSATSGDSPPKQYIEATLSGVPSEIPVLFRATFDGDAVLGVASFIPIVPTEALRAKAEVTWAFPSVLEPGIHSATITISACMDLPDCSGGIIGEPQTVNVNYLVSAVRF